MDKKDKRNILQEMLYVYEKAENCKLGRSFFNRMKPSLTNLAAFYGVTNTQAFFISIIFIANLANRTFNQRFFNGYLELYSTEFFKYFDHLQELIDRGIVQRKESSNGFKPDPTDDFFEINNAIKYAVLRNLPMPVVHPETRKSKTFMEFLDRLMEKIKKFKQYNQYIDILGLDFDGLMDENLHHPILLELREDKIDQVDSIIFLMVLWKWIRGKKKVSYKEILSEIKYEHKDNNSIVYVIQGFLNEEKEVVKKGWLEITTSKKTTNVFFSAGKKTLDNLAAMGLDKEPLQDQTEDKEKNGKKKKEKEKRKFSKPYLA